MLIMSIVTLLVSLLNLYVTTRRDDLVPPRRSIGYEPNLRRLMLMQAPSTRQSFAIAADSKVFLLIRHLPIDYERKLRIPWSITAPLKGNTTLARTIKRITIKVSTSSLIPSVNHEPLAGPLRIEIKYDHGIYHKLAGTQPYDHGKPNYLAGTHKALHRCHGFTLPTVNNLQTYVKTTIKILSKEVELVKQRSNFSQRVILDGSSNISVHHFSTILAHNPSSATKLSLWLSATCGISLFRHSTSIYTTSLNVFVLNLLHIMSTEPKDSDVGDIPDPSPPATPDPKAEDSDPDYEPEDYSSNFGFYG